MTASKLTAMERIDEGLAMLWLQMSRVGNARLQWEIEELSEVFFHTDDPPSGEEAARMTHDLFGRVAAEYTGEVQRRVGYMPIRCPHCHKED